jgi:hypothetical protein
LPKSIAFMRLIPHIHPHLTQIDLSAAMSAQKSSSYPFLI